MRIRRRLVAVSLLFFVQLSLYAAESLPAQLTDQEFWKLSSDSSEPDGTFRSDNLLSNESYFQYVIPALNEIVKQGRVYMGVGPEQNFTYIAALKPKMVFIVDIRRENLELQLMYKALFEMSSGSCARAWRRRPAARSARGSRGCCGRWRRGTNRSTGRRRRPR